MNFSYWMAAKAVIEIVFGVGFLLIPETLASLYSMKLEPGGILMARLFGTTFIFGSMILWFARNSPRTEAAVKGIVLAVVVSNTIGFVVTLLATLGNVWNALGWGPVVLYLVFGLAFAYFQFLKPTS